MNTIARDLLVRLLAAGNKATAGVRIRAPALTAAQMKPYRELRNWHQKQECEETLLAARDANAISLVRDKLNPVDGLFERINLLDVQGLARFLGQSSHADLMGQATAQLDPLKAAFPVIEEVLQRWAVMGKVRGLGPQKTTDWLDAVRVIESCAKRSTESISAPIREFSARLFRDSKRIEKLTAHLDVLLAGSVGANPRPAVEVWQEIGLFREEQPVLLAGRVQIERERVTSVLDMPFTGLPASTIGRVAGPLDAVMTIENLTTFHSEAKRRAGEATLLIYTAGMPSPAWRTMYRRLLASIPATTPVSHWGDVDEGGFRIAATIAAAACSVGHRLLPHAMSPQDVPNDMRVDASPRTLERIRHFAAAAGWPELGQSVADAGFTSEQEAL